jgi:hypothetical protein
VDTGHVCTLVRRIADARSTGAASKNRGLVIVALDLIAISIFAVAAELADTYHAEWTSDRPAPPDQDLPKGPP